MRVQLQDAKLVTANEHDAAQMLVRSLVNDVAARQNWTRRANKKKFREEESMTAKEHDAADLEKFS